MGEGNSVTVVLALSADPERSVTILLTAVGQDGADGGRDQRELWDAIGTMSKAPTLWSEGSTAETASHLR